MWPGPGARGPGWSWGRWWAGWRRRPWRPRWPPGPPGPPGRCSGARWWRGLRDGRHPQGHSGANQSVQPLQSIGWTCRVVFNEEKGQILDEPQHSNFIFTHYWGGCLKINTNTHKKQPFICLYTRNSGPIGALSLECTLLFSALNIYFALIQKNSWQTNYLHSYAFV